MGNLGFEQIPPEGGKSSQTSIQAPDARQANYSARSEVAGIYTYMHMHIYIERERGKEVHRCIDRYIYI